MRCNWRNYGYNMVAGYPRMGIQLIRTLTRLGVEVHPQSADMADLPTDLQRMAGVDYSILTISLQPPYMTLPVPGRQWNWSMWETTRFPREWGEHTNNTVGRVIVPAPWLVEVFQASGVNVPIHVIEGGIDPVEFPVLPPRCDDRPYTFMCLGDRGGRKGWDTVWRAFYNAFPDNPDVRLVIKTRDSGLDFFIQPENDTRVSIWRDDTHSLADSFVFADCFVFPTRGEGWGLPPREAAAMGIPVICTAWSSTEVGIEHWAIPISTYKLVPSIMDGGGLWATPDVDEVTAHMTWCYEHRDEAKQRAIRAADWLRANQTWEIAARKLIDLYERYGAYGNTDG